VSTACHAASSKVKWAGKQHDDRIVNPTPATVPSVSNTTKQLVFPRANALGMRHARARLCQAQYLLIKSPPASGTALSSRFGQANNQGQFEAGDCGGAGAFYWQQFC
jgi:hypothetical protein